MSSINFDNVWLLLLAIPLVALFVIPYAIAIRKDNLNGHNVASGIIHIIMALIIAFVAAGASVVTTVTETSVYVVADVSYSAEKNLGTIDGYISDLSRSLPRNSKLGVVTFGKNYQLLTPLGERPQSVRNSLVDTSATDIISALRYTGELFREDVIKRIVLITDGKQTSESDPNALKRQVDALAERNIHVDAIYLDDNMKDDTREVQISAAEVTPSTFLNGSSSARLTVNVNCPASMAGEGGVSVPYEVNTFIDVTRHRTDVEDAEPVEIPTKMESFTRGSNYYDVPLFTEEAGVYDYEVKIRAEKPEEDGNTLNNVISFTQQVAGKQSVLIIYDDETEADEAVIREAYGTAADITSYYYGSSAIQTSLEWINQFDEIVLATAHMTEVSSDYELFLKNLDTAVSMFGKSLVTFGDTNIQNNTHGELKALSDMLPVVYGKSAGQEKLYTLIIDTSRSMEQHGRLDRAKRAAIEVVNMLEDNDTVSVVQFNGNPDDVEPKLVKLSEGRADVIESINALEVRQGTNIPAALQFAVPTATGGNYAERRMMIFTDGMNFTTETSSQSVRDTVLTLRSRGVVTSALDVGREGAEAGADAAAENLLRTIAQNGSGAYMNISTEQNLQEVLETELPADVNDNEGKMSGIIVKRSTEDVLDGINAADLESLGRAFVDKFIYSRAKGAATTVLAVNFRASNSTTEVPLYSYWDYGNGKVASLTTGLSREWIDMDADLFNPLMQGIARANVPDRMTREPFTVDIEMNDGYAEVTLTPERMRFDAVTSIQIVFDNGVRTTTSAPVPLANAASAFTHTFITGDEGKYTVKLSYKERETAREYTVERTVHIAYPSEYDSFALYDEGTLHKMIGANGNVYRGSFEIVNDESEVGLYNVSLNMPLLITCVVLFAVDIAVRKLKWEDIKSLFKRRKKVNKQ